MPTLPWKAARQPDAEATYLAFASHLPVSQVSATPRFMKYAGQIRAQLRTADGLIGYSLRAKPIARQYWTLSAWEDQDALDRFVGALPHSDIMSALQLAMGTTAFVTWSAPGTAVPLSWEDAIARLAARED